jgi:hypothetical protein
MAENLSKKEIELDVRICKEGWLPLSDLTEDYAYLSSQIHVDTRDFHVNFSFESQLDDSAKKFLKELTFSKNVDYLTYEELIARLKEWKSMSGGEIKWRMINHKQHGWFKYVRVFRTEKGFIWCGSSQRGGGYVFYTNRNLSKNIDYEQYG